MLIQCCCSKVESLLSQQKRSHVAKYGDCIDIGLVVGREYPVYGVLFRDGVPWFLTCEDDSAEYPVPYCSYFFQLVDSSIRSGWALSINDFHNAGQVGILPAKWADDRMFLEKLVDGVPSSVEYFRQLREEKGQIRENQLERRRDE